MFGMPRRRVDRFLEIMTGMDVAQEELRDPLILLAGVVLLSLAAPNRMRPAGVARH